MEAYWNSPCTWKETTIFLTEIGMINRYSALYDNLGYHDVTICAFLKRDNEYACFILPLFKIDLHDHI